MIKVVDTQPSPYQQQPAVLSPPQRHHRQCPHRRCCRHRRHSCRCRARRRRRSTRRHNRRSPVAPEAPPSSPGADDVGAATSAATANYTTAAPAVTAATVTVSAASPLTHFSLHDDGAASELNQTVDTRRTHTQVVQAHSHATNCLLKPSTFVLGWLGFGIIFLGNR